MTKVENIPYGVIQTGVIIGTTGAVQMPDVACKLVAFTAVGTNAGNCYIGGPGVTVLDTTATNTVTGYELKASAQTPWIPVSNLNVLYLIGDNAGDDVTYMALS